MIKIFMLIALLNSVVTTVQAQFQTVNVLCTIAIFIAFVIIVYVKRE